MKVALAVGITTVGLSLAVAKAGLGDDRRLRGAINIQFALFLIGQAPITGNVSCKAAERCKLLQIETGVKLWITIDSPTMKTPGDLQIECKMPACLFSNGSVRRHFTNLEEFSFYGADLYSSDPSREQVIGRLLINAEVDMARDG